MVCHGSHNLDSQGARPVSDYQLNWENYWRSNVKSKKKKREHLKTIHLLSVSECFKLLFNLLFFFSTWGRNVWSWKGKKITQSGVPFFHFLPVSFKLFWLFGQNTSCSGPLFSYCGRSSIYTFSGSVSRVRKLVASSFSGLFINLFLRRHIFQN